MACGTGGWRVFASGSQPVILSRTVISAVPAPARRAGEGGKLGWGRQCQRARNRIDYSLAGPGVDKPRIHTPNDTPPSPGGAKRIPGPAIRWRPVWIPLRQAPEQVRGIVKSKRK